MHRVIAIAVAGACLAGCSSLPSFSLDSLKPTPPIIQVRLESTPPGADARTSLGPGCKTPCSVSVPAPETGFSVTYSLNKFQSATESVQVTHNPGGASPAETSAQDPAQAKQADRSRRRCVPVAIIAVPGSAQPLIVSHRAGLKL
jgi:hypothetical protein